MFSTLVSRLGSLAGLQVLDLFAGTGAMGLEALSRGAGRALLVDSAGQAARVIQDNIRRCGLADRAEFLRGEVPAILSVLRSRGPYHLVFLDPPYGRSLVPPTLEKLGAEGLLADGGLICAETAREDAVPEQVGPFTRCFSRGYGITAVHLFTVACPQESTP